MLSPSKPPQVQPPAFNFLMFPASDSTSWIVGEHVASPDIALAAAQAEATIRARDGRWPRGEVLVAVFCIRGQHPKRNGIWRLDLSGDVPVLGLPRVRDLLLPQHMPS